MIGTRRCRQSAFFLLVFPLMIHPARITAQEPSLDEIIQKSVKANQALFKAATEFNFDERDRNAKGSKTYHVTMIEGTPYYQLTALNDEPLSTEQAAAEQKKLEQVIAKRRAESAEERQSRIDKFEKERRRDNLMIDQLTEAFNFTLAGQHKLRGFTVWVLKATPKPGYKPPNMDTQVLPGMHGELWIDQQTYNWVRVTAEVIHPVSIEGFLAQVEPGTRFELENSPVLNGIWQTTHFSMKSQAKVLYMFNHASQDDETYFNYRKIEPSSQAANSSSGH